jgi:hypothetical protein
VRLQVVVLSCTIPMTESTDLNRFMGICVGILLDEDCETPRFHYSAKGICHGSLALHEYA